MFEQSPSPFLSTPSADVLAGVLAAIAIGLGSCASEPPQPTPPPAESNVVEQNEENLEAATGDRRQLDPHLHGAATLNVAIEDKSLYLEITSPAIDIVGFEHQPQTDEQKTAVRQAIATLEKGTELLTLPDAAGCRLTETTVATELLDEHDEHGHDEREEEAHAGEEADEVHSEFMATYRFECAQPQNLQQIGVNFFSTFPSLEEIEARVLTDSGQTGVELTPTQSSLSL